MVKSLVFTFLVVLMALCGGAMGGAIDGNWHDAYATFYGSMNDRGTMEGACGYENPFEQGYGLQTTALSKTLFNGKLVCGACFEIMCIDDSQRCISNAGPIKVTTTNLYTLSCSKTNWYNHPLKHFVLSMPMFTKIANTKVGIIPIRYRRVACNNFGGVKFKLSGNPNWLLVLVFNVGGAGEVTKMSIKGSKTNWIGMTRNWGQNWQVNANLVRQSLSFKVTVSDGKSLEFDNVVPAKWQFGQTYEGDKNFKFPSLLI